MSPNRATFDGLLDSGRLALIQDAGVRTLIAEYYRSGDQALTRIDERETAYPALSYQLVPRGPATGTARGAGDVTLQPGLSDDALNKLVKTVQRSPLEGHLVAEINLARFIRRTAGDTCASSTGAPICRLHEQQVEYQNCRSRSGWTPGAAGPSRLPSFAELVVARRPRVACFGARARVPDAPALRVRWRIASEVVRRRRSKERGPAIRFWPECRATSLRRRSSGDGGPLARDPA